MLIKIYSWKTCKVKKLILGSLHMKNKIEDKIFHVSIIFNLNPT
jgi:hypothetical protein